jgi:hypothetical protein
MRPLACALLTLLSSHVLAPVQAGDSGNRAQYIGGTIPGLPVKSEGRLDTTAANSLVFRTKTNSIRVPYDKINTIEYGQRVNRRIAEAVLISPLLLLAKKRKHFLTVGYADEQGRQQALVFRIDKNAVRPVLVSLEARTGRKVEFQDEEARKAGKG